LKKSKKDLNLNEETNRNPRWSTNSVQVSGVIGIGKSNSPLSSRRQRNKHSFESGACKSKTGSSTFENLHAGHKSDIKGDTERENRNIALEENQLQKVNTK
jgi:hypothetical protein